MEEWKLRDTIEKILNENITHIPYEGDEIDKESIVEEIVELIKKLDNQKQPYTTGNE